ADDIFIDTVSPGFCRQALRRGSSRALLTVVHGLEESPMPPIQHFAPPPGLKAPPLSFATRHGDLLFVSGIPGFDEKGALPETFEAQFAFIVRNIKRVLDEAGASF